MEKSESEYNRRDGASRPPRGASSYGADSTVFTEIPADSLRRTTGGERSASSSYNSYYNNTNAQRTPGGTAPRQTSGRTPQSTARPTSDAGRSAPRATPYTPQSRSYTEPRSAAPQQSRRSSPEFTEISWDSFRSGNMSAPAAEPQRTAQTPSYAQPYVDPTPSAQQPRSYSGGTNAPRDPRQSYAAGGTQRPAAQVPEYEQPDPFYGSAPQRETPAQHPHGDYYRSGAIHRPAQRTSSARPATQRPAPQPTPGGGGGGRPPQTPNGRDGRRPPRRPRIKLRYHPAVYLGVLVLVILLVFCVVKLVQKSNEKPLYTLPSYAPVTDTPKPTSTPAPEETPETTEEEEAAVSPRPTAEPTPTPTGAKAQRKGTLIVPADWGAVVPERTSAVFDSHFDRSVMIGNSLVEGFFMWSGMTNIRYIYSTGAVVNNVIGNLDLSPLTLNESTYYTDIYLMFGLNEVGTDVNSFIQSYKKLVEYIREYQTEANIYIISVTPVTQEVDADPDEVQTMDRIDSFNAALKQFCVDENCWYLDIYSMLLDDTGYLSADYAYSGDGKHFEKSGYVAWANYMKTHYVDEGLLTE